MLAEYKMIEDELNNQAGGTDGDDSNMEISMAGKSISYAGGRDTDISGRGLLAQYIESRSINMRNGGKSMYTGE